mgnify:CR=1 FL=1
MGLAQIQSSEVTSSSVTQVQLTGINDDSVYLVVVLNTRSDNDNSDFYLNYIKASDGSVDTTANYDFASYGLYSAGTFQSNSQQNANNQKVMYARGLNAEKSNALIYLYNTFSSSSPSFNTVEAVGLNYAEQTYGEQGGGTHTVNQSNSGVSFSWENTGDFSIGSKFILYKVV